MRRINPCESRTRRLRGSVRGIRKFRNCTCQNRSSRTCRKKRCKNVASPSVAATWTINDVNPTASNENPKVSAKRRSPSGPWTIWNEPTPSMNATIAENAAHGNHLRKTCRAWESRNKIAPRAPQRSESMRVNAGHGCQSDGLIRTSMGDPEYSN